MNTTEIFRRSKCCKMCSRPLPQGKHRKDPHGQPICRACHRKLYGEISLLPGVIIARPATLSECQKAGARAFWRTLLYFLLIVAAAWVAWWATRM